MKYKWTVLTVTTVGVLMSGIDSRIVIVGLPQVAAALHADAEQAIWLTQAYALGSTVALLLIGRVTDMIGRVKVYNLGFAVFTLGSALTSIATGPEMAILFRGVQGLGSAMLFTNSIALIADSTPTQELGLSLGINQLAFRFGAMAGLTISGIILAVLDWRALFYINVPIGIFGTFWAHKRLKETAQTEKGAPFDWIGFVTFTTFITTFLFSLTYAAYGLAESKLVAALMATSMVSLAAFIWYERKYPYPLLDLSLLKIREFTGGVIAQLLNAIAWGAVILLLSLYFQLVQGLSPFDAGIRILPFEMAFLLFGPLSGRFSDKYGQMPFATSGLAVTSVSLLLLSTTTPDTSYLQLASYMALMGAGIGLFASPNISSIMGSVPPGRRGIASAFRATFFNVGFTISLNLSILIMSSIVPYSVVSTLISSANPASITALDRSLFSAALDRTYLWMAVVNTLAILPSLLRGKRPDHAPSPGTSAEG
ncbi:MAG TPA: MFS transporter [Conexivisphaerales archaeon]|nr:MFS transporter [Conexivisphaerales archaeon]